MLKNIYKIILNVVLMIAAMTMIFSCSSFEPIDYNVSVAKNYVDEKEHEFNFQKNNSKQTDKVITKKNRDKLSTEKIKLLLAKMQRHPVKTRGLYYPAYVLGDKSKFNDIMEHIKNSSINTIVVDIKDDAGMITAEMDSKILNQYNNFYNRFYDFKEIMNVLKENNIYTIARVASFRDTALARKRNDLAIMTKFGYLYRDDTKYAWLNPYKKENWDYLLEIGKQCKKLGFDEIQYDYFRFSTDKGMQSVVFNEEETNGRSKSDIIIECCQYLYENLLQENMFMSVDVFGSIISSYRDQESVGQDYVDLIKYCDYISPMLYPSHYSNGYYGVEFPDLEPYKIVKSALDASKKLIEDDLDKSAHFGTVRPWLQGFTADYIEHYKQYTKNEYLEQIKAVEDAKYDEWLVWNAGGNYQWDAFPLNQQ